MKTKYGINYTEPEITILHDTGIGQAEIAGRTAYNSFEKSEHEAINFLPLSLDTNSTEGTKKLINEINDIEDSKLLSSLAWVHHHHSVIEHISITYLLQNVSRGVLQELVRHRIASYTVKSSRYTMGSIINAYTASSYSSTPRTWFIDKMYNLDILITKDERYNEIEYDSIYNKLAYQEYKYNSQKNFILDTVSKSSIPFLKSAKDADELFKLLKEGKAKRNIGDPFKHIVTDNWKTDIVMTINLRSLKNFFDLRDTGSAWFQIQWLAQEMKAQTPIKYLKLIDKKHKDT